MPNQTAMDVDWEDWEPQMRSTLVFIRKGDEVLLIQKKRGLGAGKINGPGGKIDPGETAEEAAVRETEEEIGITPRDLQRAGELHFQFADGLSIHCTVFITEAFDGEPIETDEAVPMWCHRSEIPYEDMWQDDIHWLPEMLEGKPFRGYFTFDGDTMLSKELAIGFLDPSDQPAHEEDALSDNDDDDDAETAVTVDEGDILEERELGLDEVCFARLQRIIESLLIASDTALTTSALVKILRKVVREATDGEEETETLPEAPWMKTIAEHQVAAAIRALNEEYQREGRAFVLAERAAGWKIFTRPDFAPWVRGIYPDKKPQRLSSPALETLAIIAYRQPLTKADIEAVRGVNVDSVLKMLLDRGLIHISGRADVPGRPLLYQTTESFLDHFGIKTVDELPNADELRHVKLPTVGPSPAEVDGFAAEGLEEDGGPEDDGVAALEACHSSDEEADSASNGEEPGSPPA